MKSRRNFPPNLEADIKFASCPTVMLLLVVLRYVSSSKACVWLIIKSEFKEMDYTSPFRATVSTKQPRYLCYWCCGSVAKLYPILCNPMDYSTPGFPVLHYLPEFSQILVHWVGDAIQLFHPLLPSSPFACNLSSIRVFSAESALHIRWPKYWSFSFSPSSEYSGLISFRIDWFELLAVQGTLKSLLQQHSSKVSILQCSTFFTVRLSHPYMTTGKTIALTRWTLVGKVMTQQFHF